MTTDTLAAFQAFVDRLLDNHKKATWQAFAPQPLPKADQALAQQLLWPVLRAGGTVLAAAPLHECLVFLLQWSMAQLRPDNASSNHQVIPPAWSAPKKWWPAMMVMCHYGFLSVSDLAASHPAHASESPGDYLCRLWQISRATYYRCLRQARRQMAHWLWQQYEHGRYTHSIQTFTQHTLYQQQNLTTAAQQQRWHSQQAAYFQPQGDYLAVIWHLRMSRDFAAVNHILTLHVNEIAQDDQADLEIEAIQAEAMPPPLKIEMLCATAAIYRIRNDAARELKTYQTAQRLANQFDDTLSLARINSELGQYYEGRDSDRALAHYQLSLDFWATVGQESRDTSETYIYTIIRLAWLYTLRGDPRAKPLLSQANQLPLSPTSSIKANLERAWGEYWRREKALDQALEHTHRALSIDELLANESGIVIDYLNLGVIYEELNRLNEAIDYYQKIQAVAQTTLVNPEQLVGASLNVGICYFYLQNYERAVQAYEQGLAQSRAAGLPLLTGRAHYNLAETFYTQYLHTQDEAQVQAGEAHQAAAMAVFRAGNFMVEFEAAASLKEELWAGTKEDNEQQILPQEKAIHFEAITTIEKCRAALLAQEESGPAQWVRWQMAIARSYLSIAAQERDGAMQVCARHGLQQDLGDDIEALQTAFVQAGRPEAQLKQQWQTAVGGHLPRPMWTAVLDYLLDQGTIKKGAYVTLCRVSPATASKHLKRLADANLVQRRGSGRSTHYVLRPL